MFPRMLKLNKTKNWKLPRRRFPSPDLYIGQGIKYRGNLKTVLKPKLSTMFLILLLDIVYWIAILTGLALTWAWKGPRRWRALPGVVSLIVLALGLPVSSMLWPPDWLVPVSSSRASATLNSYALSYVQKPGIDFYMDTLEIKGDDGKMAVVHINVDNGKCWFGWAETSDREVAFHCFPWGRMATVKATWLEQNMELCRTERCDLSIAYLTQR